LGKINEKAIKYGLIFSYLASNDDQHSDCHDGQHIHNDHHTGRKSMAATGKFN
jgi:hypothetical protein